MRSKLPNFSSQRIVGHNAKMTSWSQPFAKLAESGGQYREIMSNTVDNHWYGS